MSQIFIVSGATASGKSTRVFNWLKKQPSSAGILQLVENNQRWLLSWPDREMRPMEELLDPADGISVGRFIFSRDAFAWGRTALQRSAILRPDWLVIDEIGKLELRGEGLEPASGRIIKNNPTKKGLIIVVREELVEKVGRRYDLKDTVKEMRF